jgi:hypothetical protein
MGHYVRWVYEHPEKSMGLDLKVPVEHVSLSQLATTFTEVTGKPTKATALNLEDWFNENG